jgi:hypothetical protein
MDAGTLMTVWRNAQIPELGYRDQNLLAEKRKIVDVHDVRRGNANM